MPTVASSWHFIST